MKRHALNGNAENTHPGVIRICNKAVYYLEPFWLLAALGSVVLLFAESAKPVISQAGYSLLSYQTGEYLFTFIFTVEYLLRLLVSQHRTRYMTEIMQRRRRYRRCQSCQSIDHSENTRYCQQCGALLDGENDKQSASIWSDILFTY
ncbi:hypothetical protein DEO48_05400 [Enterobacter sp. CGMCC 5087]|uniref:hypothetical protein n=1 Tax=Enterobacter sp. CGMCC 5087 TaxID=2183878 RepID=UPI000D675E1B|nr:hypothetical protein [Enterobacter sp. CGMCC 5087]PWI81100.1 hypothetical protein DEO48_05400 [Enterobacter sp. CGMCC 5087]